MVVQQHSRKLLKMGILMPETCWVSKKKNKNSKWHLVGFLFFSYHKMHGPINIRFKAAKVAVRPLLLPAVSLSRLAAGSSNGLTNTWRCMCSFWAPDDGRKNRLKHVERLTEINKLRNVASCWLCSANILAMHGHMNVKCIHLGWAVLLCLMVPSFDFIST